MVNRLLVLSTTFPPETGGRAVRLRTRLKYLIRDHGWEPVVQIGQEDVDESSVDIAGRSVPVYRTLPVAGENSTDSENGTSPMDRLKSLIAPRLFPDHYVMYLPRIVRNADQIIRDEDIDAVYTMCYPFSFHLAGWALKQRHDVGWLAEFRDPWVTNPNHFDGQANLLHRFLERLVVSSSDQIVYNYGIQVPENYFAETYPWARDKVTQLDCPGSCGFDFERIGNPPGKRDAFSIVYGGTFYGDGHTPETFLRGLDSFVRAEDVEIRADFFGDWNPEYQTLAERLDLEDIVYTHGWVDFDVFFPELQRAHVALFIVRPFPGDERNVPQKVIDYVAAGVPMLVLAPDNWEVAEYTREHGIGVVADPSDPSAVREALTELMEAYQTGSVESYTAGQELRTRIDAETQTREFANALERTLP